LIRGVIFDLDGTLIDSMKIWPMIDRKLLKENGVENPPADISDRVKKMTIVESSQYFIDEFGLECSNEYIINRIEELVRKEYEENIPLKPYVREFLDFLDEKKIPYGIATATYKGLAEAVLKRCGIWEHFRFLITEEEYPLGKRFPDIFLGGAERLGFEPREILVVEDSLHCIKTASKAGFITAGVYDEVSLHDKKSIADILDHYAMSMKGLESLFS